jgi:hypothetical protein
MNFPGRFFVDEEKKVVVCKLEYCSNELICDLCGKGWPGHEALVIEDTFIGKAQCSPEDTFDVEIGKEIAYKRAVAKLFKAKRRALSNFVKSNQEMTNRFTALATKLIGKYDGTINRKDQDIMRILGEDTK